MKKRILGIVLVLAMALSLLPFGASGAIITGAEPWDGRTGTAFQKGSGTESDPYLIETGAQLYYLTTLSTAADFYKLTRNINLGDKLFPSIAKLSGTLDGNGFRIVGLSLSGKSLITECSGTIKNLTLDGALSADGNLYPFAETLTGSILNCVNDCTVTSANGNAAGFVGTIVPKGTVKNCVNRAAISGKTAAGIAYMTQGNSTLYNKDARIPLKGCTNIGSITAQKTAAGIIVSHNNGTISCCVNTGAVTSSTEIAGGVVGNGRSTHYVSISYVNGQSRENWHKYQSYLHDCYNVGTVTGKTNAGGIAGTYFRYNPHFTQNGQSYNCECMVEQCYNVGTVKATGDSGHSGDILGKASSTEYPFPTGEGNLYISGKNSGADVTFGTAYSNSAMQGIGAYTGYDFSAVWTWDSTNAYRYPILREVGLPPKACTHSYVHTDSVGTCGGSGYQIYQCSKCGDTYKDYTAKIEHTFGAWTVETEATCSAAGAEKRTCTRCGASETRAVEALGHDYRDAVTAPTCTEKGYTTHTCSRCNDTFTDSYAAALGHDYKDVVTAPTCTEKGYTTHTCSRCGDSYTDTYVAALGHAWDAGVEIVVPKCGQPGEKSFLCTRCGETKTEPVAALGHDYKDVVTAPTCTEKGYTTHTCSRCNDTFTDSYVDALGHDYKDVVTAPTCTEKGYTTHTCSRCNDTFTDTYIDALGHDYKDVVTAPTCTEKGYTTHTCSRCNDTHTDSYVAALGHDYKDVVTAPTCTEKGYTTHTCSRCSDSYVDSYADALGHDTELKNAAAATCTRDGYTGDEVCKTCGEIVKKGSVIKATGHKWDAGQVTKEPTETAEGVKTFTCTVCKATRTESIPKLTPTKPANPFKDVKEGAYYYDPVLWALNHDPQITDGTSETTFSPDATCTRGQVVTFLWRANGCPEPKSTSNPFKDVKSGDYFYKAVLWAVEKGITDGTSETTFSPNAPCTRAHVVTFLWRADGKPAAVGTNPFKDVAADAYYYQPVLWAGKAGITDGVTEDSFAPDRPCTRGQIVTFLYRDKA